MSEIKKYLKRKEVGFKWTFDGKEFEVYIAIPDCCKNEYSVWGDWGPKYYKIKLKPEESIVIDYREKETGVVTKTHLDVQSFHLDSPASAKLRDKYPLMYIVPGPNKSVVFQLYANSEGEIKMIRSTDQHNNEIDTEWEILS